MRRKRISQGTTERCLLTDIAPFETPLLFSNWGSYNYLRKKTRSNPPQLLRALIFEAKGNSIPFQYRIRKDANSARLLGVVHPKCSEAIVDLYRKFDQQMIKLCGRSKMSLRFPARVAKFFIVGKGRGEPVPIIEEVTANSAYASSYFAYREFSHLHKFFETDEYADLEKRFAFMSHVDISKCFPSIYTHSIAWAVRGKTFAKDRLLIQRNQRHAIDDEFDNLMQQINYRETHGIIVGPELSRIFAEIILQKVDLNLAETLKDLDGEKVREGFDFRAFRYIDDYYLFYNDPGKESIWIKCLERELEKFRLYLSSQKGERMSRPFITDISMAKLQLSGFMRELVARLGEMRMASAHQEINRVRAILKDRSVVVSNVSSYLLSIIERAVWRTDPKNDNYGDQLYILLELACHTLRMDIRVPCCFKWIRIAHLIARRGARLEPPDRQRVRDKLFREWRGAIEDAFALKATVEGHNLLIAATMVGPTDICSKEVLETILEKCRGANHDELSRNRRLNYFDIVSILYAIRNRTDYADIRKEVLKDAGTALDEFPTAEYAETAHLLLDLLSCPWLSEPEKDGLVQRASRASKIGAGTQAVAELISYSRREVWYFNWDQKNRISLHLKKKELLLSY